MDQTLLPFRDLLTKNEKRQFNQLYITGMFFLIAATVTFTLTPWFVVQALEGKMFSYLGFMLPVVFVVCTLVYANKKDKLEAHLHHTVSNRVAETLLLKYGMIPAVTPIRVEKPQMFYDLSNERQEGIVTFSQGELELSLFAH